MIRAPTYMGRERAADELTEGPICIAAASNGVMTGEKH
jgi:hypothetical protein